MEEVNNSFDVDGKFGEIQKIFETCKENGHSGEYKGIAIKVVNNLTVILKKSEPKKSLRSSIGFANLLIR